MERVGILINKLQEQLRQEADADKMLVTAQMLYTELLAHTRPVEEHSSSKISVVLPKKVPAYTPAQEKPQVVNGAYHPENFTEVKQEAEETNKPAEKEKGEMSEVAKKEEKREGAAWGFDPIEAPTLAQQEKVVYELNETIGDTGSSLNDKLKEEKHEVASLLKETPIRDLKKAISINDRHNFIQDLFRGDETMYERSIKTINNFGIFAEAEYWIQRELKLKLGWDSSLPEVKLFDQLVKRRFS